MSLIEPLPDRYEGDPGLLPPGEAMRRSRAHVRPVDVTERVAVVDALALLNRTGVCGDGIVWVTQGGRRRGHE